MPREIGAHLALRGGFSVLTIDDDWRVAFEQTRRSAHHYDASAALDDYTTVLTRLRHLALDPKHSQTLLTTLRKETR